MDWWPQTTHNPWNPITHSFVATTEGGVIHTYSWGNTPDQFTQNGWNENKPEDLVAAWEAIRENGYLESLEPKGTEGRLDPYIKKAFEILKNDPASNHRNGGVVINCKTEAIRLLNVARGLQKADQEAKKKKEQERKRAPKHKTPDHKDDKKDHD